MAKHRNDTLDKARKYSDFLLYQATGGTIGKPPKSSPNDFTSQGEMTMGEKRGLLDSLIKIAAMEGKFEEPPDSAFDLIKRGLNGSQTTNDERDYGRDERTGNEPESEHGVSGGISREEDEPLA